MTEFSTNDLLDAVDNYEEVSDSDNHVGFVAPDITIVYSRRNGKRFSALARLSEDQIDRFEELGCELKAGDEDGTFWFNGYADLTGKLNSRYGSINKDSVANLHISLNVDDGYCDLLRIHVVKKPADAPRKLPTRTVSF